MKRKSRPYAPDLREDWQVAQGLHCPCGGFDEMCVCQNVDEPWRYGRGGKPPSAQQDLEQRIRELEGTVRTLELQQQTDRQTIASLLAARPAVVSDEVVEAMARGFLEGLNEGRSLEFDALQPGDWAELRSAMRSALALLPGGVPDREAIAGVIGSYVVYDDKGGPDTEVLQDVIGGDYDESVRRVYDLTDQIIAMLSASPKEVSHGH